MTQSITFRTIKCVARLAPMVKEISSLSSKEKFLVQIEVGVFLYNGAKMTDEKDTDIEQTFTAAGTFFIGLMALALVTLIFALPFMYVWNNILVETTTCFKEIGYWQSVMMLFFIFMIGRIFNLSNK